MVKVKITFELHGFNGMCSLFLLGLDEINELGPNSLGELIFRCAPSFCVPEMIKKFVVLLNGKSLRFVLVN